MRVRMLVPISGGRGDGTFWPPVGGLLDVDPDEGVALCKGGLAVPVPQDDPPVEVAAPAPAETRSEPPVPPAEPAPSPEPAPEPAGDPGADGRPIVNAPKADWVDYAVSLGWDRGLAESMTKNDLLARFGPRGE